MAHVEKYTAGAMGHMLNHYDRSKEKLPENVDPERTHLNYNLAADQQQLGQAEFIRKRCSEVRVQKRKDVNVLCSWVVTAPKDFNPNDYKIFFEETYSFLQDRYGKENVISAWVHMDETTPHMHYAFVPVVEDRRRGGFKLSAKEMITRRDLQTFHSSLEAHMERIFGYEIGIMNDATKDGNKSVVELKRMSATERLEDAAVQAAEIVSRAHEEAEHIKASVLPLQAEYEAQRAYIDGLKEASKPEVMYPDYAKRHKVGNTVTVPAEMWEGKHIAAQELGFIKTARAAVDARITEFNKLAPAKEIRTLRSRVKALENDLGESKQEVFHLRRAKDQAEHDFDQLQDKVQKTLQKMPDKEAAMQFVQTMQSLDRSRSGPVR